MNSCLYECDILHARLKPKRYDFRQKLFTFYLDLDELDELAAKSRWFSRGRFNLYDFRDSDHLVGPGSTARANVESWLRSRGAEKMPAKWMLLTHVRVLGHVFNPVSFYFGFDASGRPQELVAEVGNTFGEQKPFRLGPEKFSNGAFRDRQTKYYYISPFIDLDAELDFNVEVPGARLAARVDDWKDGEKFFISTMTGERREFSDRNLLKLGMRYPFVTLQVIAMIHWHAFRLWMKGMPARRIEDQKELQRGVTRESAKKR